VRNGLCEADDADAVRELLGCTERWARKLTQGARELAKAARDEEIARLAAAGLSTRQIAEETGVPNKTVHDAVVRKRNTSVSAQGSRTTEPTILYAPAGEPKSRYASSISPFAAHSHVDSPAFVAWNDGSNPASWAENDDFHSRVIPVLSREVGAAVFIVAGSLFDPPLPTQPAYQRRGAETANNAGNNITGAANAQASGIVGSANAISNGLTGAGNAYQQYSLLNRFMPQGGAGGGYSPFSAASDPNYLTGSGGFG